MAGDYMCLCVQGTVLLGKGLQPQAVWRFEAVMVLVSGHWPPRGLLSGCWPPRSASPTDPDGCDTLGFLAAPTSQSQWRSHTSNQMVLR
jgi:hypothetical protein